MVYLIALIATLFAAYFNDRMSPTLRKALLSAICIYVILVMGFRYKVGVDTIAYMRAFNRIPSIEHILSAGSRLTTRFEPGFLLICSICKSFTNQFWPVQLIFATITTGSIFIFLHRYCRNVFLGVLFYFILQCLYFSAEIIRESAAVGLFLLNFKNLKEQKWLKYYLFAFIPLMFHYSAIITFFFPLAKWLKSNLVFIIACIFFLMITPFVERVNEMLNLAAISGKVEQSMAVAEDLNLLWRVGELIRSAFPAIAVAFCFKICKKNYEFDYLIRLQILFCVGAFAIPMIFSRFSNYTALFVTVGIATILTIPAFKLWMKAFLVAFILLTQSYYFYSMYTRWIPYVSVFYPQELPFRNDIYRHSFLPWLKILRMS